MRLLNVTPSPAIPVSASGPQLVDQVHRQMMRQIDDINQFLRLLVNQGLDADKPSAGFQGRFWYSSDTATMYYDNGTTWTAL